MFFATLLVNCLCSTDKTLSHNKDTSMSFEDKHVEKHSHQSCTYLRILKDILEFSQAIIHADNNRISNLYRNLLLARTYILLFSINDVELHYSSGTYQLHENYHYLKNYSLARVSCHHLSSHCLLQMLNQA